PSEIVWLRCQGILLKIQLLPMARLPISPRMPEQPLQHRDLHFVGSFRIRSLNASPQRRQGGAILAGAHYTSECLPKSRITGRKLTYQHCRLTNCVPLYEDRPPRDGLSSMERFATFTTLPYSFHTPSAPFGSHLTRS